MKNKKQNQVASDNGANGTNNVEQGNTTALSFTDDDKEKGNLKHFSLAKKIIKKLKARNVEFLYPLQVQTYETIHDQKDCFIQAASGTGKTLAFALPLVQLLQHDNAVELADGRTPRVLVVAPTRDITKQISDEFQSFVNDLVVLSTYNAKKKSEDQDAAIANGCDVLVATPDRLKDLLEQSKIDVSGVKHVVFDEVDRMLETEVMDNLKKILKHVFTSEQETKAQLIVFSETMPDAVRKLTKKYLSDDYNTVTFASKTSATNADDEGDDDDDDDDEDADETVNTSSNKVSGSKNASSGSLLTHKENYTTYTLSVQDELKGAGLVYTMLRKCFGDDFDGKGVIPQVAFTKDYKSAVFELPSEYDEQLQSQWKNTARIQILPITELPDIDEGSTVDNSGYSGQSRGGGGRPQRGGGGGGYGAGNRNSGRSSACFKCNKEGHKSFECPEGGSSQQNGGNRSGSGCFNCGKEGHRSFECTEPKKAGGRGGAGGERSNACFNCGKEGHRSFECTEPKKAGGRGGAGGERSNACFNCGQEGHRSFECTEPKKERSSFGGGGRGGGGRGGGRGGARGGGRGGGGWDGGNKRSFNSTNENGHSAGETTNKKIKFDDDDDE